MNDEQQRKLAESIEHYKSAGWSPEVAVARAERDVFPLAPTPHLGFDEGGQLQQWWCDSRGKQGEWREVQMHYYADPTAP